MLVLSLLLGALSATGVNAMIGADVSVVKISETEGICGDSCYYDNVFFGMYGKSVCWKNEAVNALFHGFVQVQDCPQSGRNEQKLKEGELRECAIGDLAQLTCDSYKSGGESGKGAMISQFSELKKELQSASPTNSASPVGEQGSAKKTELQPPANTKPASQWSRECLTIVKEKVRECLVKNPSQVAKCDKEGSEAGNNCEKGK